MNLEWPMKMTSYLEIFTSAWSMSLCYYIACRFMFPIWNNCFQSTYFVSNLKRLFSMSFFCFQYKEIVSNLKSYFQSNLFPMYVSNLHITNKTDEKFNVKTSFFYYFAKYGLVKFLIIYSTTRNHLRSKSHGPIQYLTNTLWPRLYGPYYK